MKRIILLIFLLLSLSVYAEGQVTTQQVIQVTTDITGASSCINGNIYYQGTTGKNWERVNGVCTRVDGVGAGPGTVTSVSVVTANGVSGTVATATTTPALTLNITALDAAKIADGTVSSAEFQFLNTVTSNVQTQIDSKQATLTFGTGVQTALGVNVGSAGAPVINGGALGSPSSVGTIPAFTLGGTVAGGGNQLNNIIIGTTTPQAGSFTTVIGSTSIKAPFFFSAAADVADAGAVRLGNNEFIDWESNPTGTDLFLGINTSNALQTNAMVLVNLNAATAPTGATGTGVQLVGTDATVVRYEADGIGAQAFFSARRAGGTGAALTATPTTTQIGAFNWHGYDGAAWTGPQASISALTTQLFTASNQGTKVTISTTPNNSTTLTVGLTVDQDQSVATVGVLKAGSSVVSLTNAAGNILGAALVGTDITTVGTIGTGIWQGTIVSSTYGGTGINNGGRTLTLNTNSGTLAFGAASKTLTINNTLTFAGTDSTTMTFPSTSASVARIDAAQTFVGVQTFPAAAASAPGIAMSNSATTGIYSDGAGRIGLTSAGTFGLLLDANRNTTLAGTLSIGSGDLTLARLGGGSLRLGLAANATPVANMFSIGESSRSGTDSNIAGANGTIQPGAGTGNSTGASLIFNTPVAVASGTGAQTQTPTITLQNGNTTVNGTLSVTGASIMPTDSLTDNGSTIATDASLGNNFRVTALTANVTLSNPTNPTDGQTVTWEIIQNASAAKTLAFGANFGFGAEITGCTISTTLSGHNFVTAIYNSTTTKWYVRGCLTGY